MGALDGSQSGVDSNRAATNASVGACAPTLSPDYADTPAAISCSSPTWPKHWLNNVLGLQHPVVTRGGLVSEVAVPGRTAHEGKPASHDTSVPSPPHPPEGAGTLGRYRCGLDQRRPPYQRRRPEAFAFLADAVNYARITRRLPQPGSLPIRCRNPASSGRDAFSWPDGPARRPRHRATWRPSTPW